MSGYRRLKRALGETNLERKCRFLFGLCLAILIFIAFLSVESTCQRLVLDVTNKAGHDSVGMALLDIHWEFWNTKAPENMKAEEHKALRESFTGDLRLNRFESQPVRLPGNEFLWLGLNRNTEISTNQYEQTILEELKREWKDWMAQAKPPEGDKATESPSGAVTPEVAVEVTAEPTSVPFRAVAFPEHNKYYYYEPIIWTRSCRLCHEPVPGVLPASELGPVAAEEPPFLAVRVVMDYNETRNALINVWATLIGTGILTVFVAMLGLHQIVKYVIVKPLAHLRDVSDAISQGKTQQRADIHTNDEFEDLADAYNRMLRHLTETQSKLEATNTNLDAKVDELAQVNMRLYEMNRLKSDFLANMSHELRTPLNSIIGFSDVLHGIDSLTDKQRRYAQNIQKSGRVLLDMINDILDLAKLEADKMELRPTEFRLDAVIMAQCDMMRSLSEDKNIDLEVLVDSDNPPIYQDQSKVQQILTNLLSNAIKFTPEGGRITVRAERSEDDFLRLTVADTGVGISEEDRDIIFEKFRQARSQPGHDTLTREYSGTGLGLSIVKELCKLLGGEISFTSELGKGSTFLVVLPWSLPNRTRHSAPLVTSKGSEIPAAVESPGAEV